MGKGRKKQIGLLSATQAEGSLLAKALGRCRKQVFPPGRCADGAIAGRPVVYAVSGIGKTNAAHAATLLIHYYMPSLIINFGVGGAYPSSGLALGDVAVATKEIYGDEGVITRKGMSDLREIGIPLLRKGRRGYFNDFPFDRGMVGSVMEIFRKKDGYKVAKGAFVTVSACTGLREKAEEDERKFRAICENMEGAAVAHICALYGVPLIEIRGISNIVQDRDRDGWDLKKASLNCQKAVMELLGKINI